MGAIVILFEEFVGWVEYVLRWMPARSGRVLRRIYYRRLFSSVGKYLTISEGCVFNECSNISIGEAVGFGPCNQVCAVSGRVSIGSRSCFNSNAMLNADAGGSIVIGSSVIVGPNVVMRASNHRFEARDRDIREQGHTGGIIFIEDNVWIGANVVIMPDVRIGAGTVIGAGSVVTRDVAGNSVAVGSPARVIKER